MEHLVLAGFVFITCVAWFLIKNPLEKGPPLPPGPRGFPILGYLPFLRKNFHVQYTELAKQYGPIYKFWLGNKLCTVITSPVLVKEIVRDQDTTFANRDAPIAALIATYGGNDIVWTNYDAHWRAMRRIFSREMLSNNNIEGSYPLRRQEVKKALKEVHSLVGTPVNIGQISFFAELNVIMSMIWGSTMNEKELKDIGREFWGVVSKLVDLLGKPNISDFFPILARLDVQGIEKEMKNYVQCIDRIIDRVVKVRTEMEKGKVEERNKDFLQTLLDLSKKKDPKMSINMMEIRALLMDTIVGGTDTTATLVQWAMAELLKHDDKMEKVQNELSLVVGLNTILEESHLPSLPYLDAVVKETLRLHPAVPLLLPRRPSKSSIVGGYTIPKNSTVFLNIWAIQRDPTLWDHPLEFIPERFLEEGIDKWDLNGSNCQYLPFGSGRRTCAGLALGERTLKYILASLLHAFEWRLLDGEKLDMTEKLGLVLRKSTPLLAIPIPRLGNDQLYEYSSDEHVF